MRAALLLLSLAGCAFDPDAIFEEEAPPSEPGSDPGALAPESSMARAGDHGAAAMPETDPPGYGEPCTASSDHEESWSGGDFDHGRGHGGRHGSSDCSDGCGGDESDSCAPYGLVCDNGYCAYP
jgi:hypothetical protein